VLLLALDTCDPHGSVAVLRDAEVLGSRAHDSAEEYSSWLLPSVTELLASIGLGLADIEVYAAAAGPGSFTGVRVALTTAKAWAEVYGRRIAVVSRLEAIAAQGTGSEPYVAAFAAARRGQIYGALYRKAAGKLERVGDEMVIAPERFVVWAVEQSGLEAIGWVSTEPACVTETQTWAARRSLGETFDAAALVLAPAIGRIGHQLSNQGRLVDALDLDANYVRRSDADTSWQDRQGSQGTGRG
jgi:tRNA threonylcarbamoyladenosine biosynthesis protein TsaB